MTAQFGSSVFAHLWETMPFQVAFTNYNARNAWLPAVGTRPQDFQLDAATVRRCATLLHLGPGNGRNFTQRRRRQTGSRARLWAFRHRASELASVHDLDCRVSSQGFHQFRVLERLDFGGMNNGQFGHSVWANVGSHRCELPLTGAYLHSKWRVQPTGRYDIATGVNRHWLWPLNTDLDIALVLAFAYEVSRSGQVTRFTGQSEDQDAAQALSVLRGSTADAAQGGEEGVQWWLRAHTGSFMPAVLPHGRDAHRSGPPATGRAAGVGQTREVTVTPHRVLVVLSLSLCRETDNFEPSGVIRFARFYPHIMVKANVALSRIDTAVKYRRPATTHVCDGPLEHSGCSSSTDQIHALLTADSNYNPPGPNQAYMPFWGGTFAYVLPDAANSRVAVGGQRIRGNPVRMVERYPGRGNRTIRAGDRWLHTTGQRVREVIKVPGQGSFDNLHLAPTLRLDAAQVSLSALAISNTAGDVIDALRTSRQAVDRRRLRLDDIVMAPFCDHDCLHTHWRWSSQVSDRFVRGWGTYAPHSVPGAPMVPRNQELNLIVHDRHQVTFEGNAAGNIPALEWQPFMHFGSAYATAYPRVQWGQLISSGIMGAARGSASAGSTVTFYNSAGQEIDIDSNSAVFYWNLRYRGRAIGSRIEARERVRYRTSRELQRAIDG